MCPVAIGGSLDVAIVSPRSMKDCGIGRTEIVPPVVGVTSVGVTIVVVTHNCGGRRKEGRSRCEVHIIAHERCSAGSENGEVRGVKFELFNVGLVRGAAPVRILRDKNRRSENWRFSWRRLRNAQVEGVAPNGGRGIVNILVKDGTGLRRCQAQFSSELRKQSVQACRL